MGRSLGSSRQTSRTTRLQTKSSDHLHLFFRETAPLSRSLHCELGTVGGSTAERYLNDHKIASQPFPDAAAACEAPSNGSIEAVVYDAPILRYQLTKLTNKNLRPTGNLFEKEGYGIGLRQNSAYRAQINKSLLKLIEDGTLEDLDKKWFGEPSADK